MTDLQVCHYVSVKSTEFHVRISRVFTYFSRLRACSRTVSNLLIGVVLHGTQWHHGHNGQERHAVTQITWLNWRARSELAGQIIAYEREIVPDIWWFALRSPEMIDSVAKPEASLNSLTSADQNSLLLKKRHATDRKTWVDNMPILVRPNNGSSPILTRAKCRKYSLQDFVIPWELDDPE